jgi:CheY-like chemotaxis protein
VCRRCCRGNGGKRRDSPQESQARRGDFRVLRINPFAERDGESKHLVIRRASEVASFLNPGQGVNGTPTVLVVDDEPLVRWSVAETLVDSGYAVTQAGDALQALESVKAAPADVVLLDVWLPDSTDLGLVSVMRRLSPESKIILMTAYGSKALNEEARSRGAFGVLDKPFDMSMLPTLVAEALAA